MKLKSIFSNSFGILLSRITGLGRNTLVAITLGASGYSDMFFVAFKLANMFRRIFAEGAFTQAFMPSFVDAKQKGVFATAIFLRFMLFIIAMSIMVSFFPEIVTKLLVGNWTDEKIAQTAPFTAINFWYLDLIFMVTFMGTLLQYREHFITTAISTALLNISMITALYFYMNDDPLTILYALSISVLIGGLLQVVTHIVALKHFNLHRILIGGWRYRKEKDVTEDKKKFTKLFIPSVWGNSAPQFASYLDTFLASFLITGSISYLFYANLLFQLPLGLIAIATATALFPSISKALSRGDEESAYSNLGKAFWLLAFLLGISALGGVIFAEPIVWLLFEYGKFTPAMTIETANVLSMYMIGLLPYGFAKLFSMFLYASDRHAKAAKIATIALLVNMMFSLILMQYMGAMGLALAGSIGGWVLFTLSVKEVGFDRLIEILKDKKLLYFIVTLGVSAILFLFINNLLMDWIR
ncbi:MAG TPA: murein biosynthesis integral membrane protein MurJ [Campylobacterales bacterium]|nr:murein biosynthesis integral membrane protein MurJ [Campylobacterales bacterium]